MAKQLLGEKLKACREKAGLTIAQMEERTGVPSRTIQDIEYGVTKQPGFTNVAKLAAALKLNLDDLVKDEPGGPRAAEIPDMSFAAALIEAVNGLPAARKQYVLALIFRDEAYLSTAALRQAYRAAAKSV
jgi:transcriptional regulator with XRE-family HTH domain